MASNSRVYFSISKPASAGGLRSRRNLATSTQIPKKKPSSSPGEAGAANSSGGSAMGIRAPAAADAAPDAAAGLGSTAADAAGGNGRLEPFLLTGIHGAAASSSSLF